ATSAAAAHDSRPAPCYILRMPLVSLSGIDFDYGRVAILRGADLSLEPGQRAAVVGRNGVGKSTLFALITGELRADAGTVDKGRRLRIAHLAQDRALAAGASLFAGVRAQCRELVDLEGAMHTALARLESLRPGAEHDEAALRYAALQHDFETRGGYALDQQVASTLTGLGFRQGDFDRPVEQLSGGEQRVAALAATLLQGADLLLLDEPTNHLDLSAITWLEEHLAVQKSALLVVSHDRSFLNRLCTVTYHLKDARLTRYSGNYAFFETERAERDRLAMLAYERQQEEIARTEDYIRRNIVGQKTKQAQSRRKRLEKMERLERPSEERTLRLRLSPARRGGNTVLVAEGLAKAFGEKRLFDDVDLHVTRGETIGLVGPNGAGKTTLVRILMGQLAPDTGAVRLGKDVDLGFFDQHLDLVSDTHTVEAEFRTVDPLMSDGECRGQLARFGFFADDLDKTVAMLSGGERNRLSLLKLVYQRHNFLILDEPTNHLDIAATESLEEALAAYSGTLIVISHDRSFLEGLAKRVIEVRDGGVTDFHGPWREFLRRGAPAVEAESAKPAPALTTGGGSGARRPDAWSKNRLAQRRRELASLEASIAGAQAEKAEVETALAGSHALGREEIMRLTARHQELAAALERREERWARWAEEIEEQEGLGG
ncbi:ABC-F family ATP-binding cassette domain-containing protein, partial [bacterium]|nr:ABC-F family ATP-binding cassette domain-containing protein [bacterium]